MGSHGGGQRSRHRPGLSLNLQRPEGWLVPGLVAVAGWRRLVGPGSPQVSVLNQLLAWGWTLESQSWVLGSCPTVQLGVQLRENGEKGLLEQHMLQNLRICTGANCLFIRLPNVKAFLPPIPCPHRPRARCSSYFSASWNLLYPLGPIKVPFGICSGYRDAFLGCSPCPLPHRSDTCCPILIFMALSSRLETP